MKIYEQLANVQHELKCNKSLYNSFGKYSYRSTELIMEAVKPLLFENDLCLIITDSVELIGDRFYIKATATIYNKEGEQISTTAYAREEEGKKGMDASQVTGSTSSYARKYALNGLLAIDDTKDADATNTHGITNDSKTAATNNKTNNTTNTYKLTEGQIKRLYAIGYKKGYSREYMNKLVNTKYKKPVEDLTKEEYDYICNTLGE